MRFILIEQVHLQVRNKNPQELKKPSIMYNC
ncbi:hypothetical protein NQ314_016864 [Rhamnusium bicolor]|uniref:Uncharacterized protein n=1 Tax=Rhamnusium bicolor TaxID=1586634 RepID=A0AAV8WVN7_9CUCU|nr:hypothetical protein NQ314_016864 [Rhamnusium bicolor]